MDEGFDATWNGNGILLLTQHGYQDGGFFNAKLVRKISSPRLARAGLLLQGAMVSRMVARMRMWSGRRCSEVHVSERAVVAGRRQKGGSAAIAVGEQRRAQAWAAEARVPT